ncbi:hypothetical protein B0J14DRAFT_603271 [Halenospora varia]|nr:hypothetical protein B0J14DRAFT_603271 [Halenospora varia]
MTTTIFIDELGVAPSDKVLNVDELDREGSSGEEIDEDGSSEEEEVDEDGSSEEEVYGSSEEEVDEDEEEVDEDELGKQLDLSNNEFEARWNAILAKHTPKHKETEEELQRRKEADDYLDRNENKTRLLNVKSLTSLSRRMGQSIGPQQHFNTTSVPPIQRPSPSPICQSGPNNHDQSPFSSGAIKRQKNHKDESPIHRSPKHIRTRSPSRCQTELQEDNGPEASTTATLPEASTYTTEALPRPLATTCHAKPARRSNQIRQPFIPGTAQFAGLKAITLGLIKDPKQPGCIVHNIVTATFDARGRFAMRVNCQDMDGHYIPLPAGIRAPASFEDINLLPQWREYSSDNIREAVASEYARQ